MKKKKKEKEKIIRKISLSMNSVVSRIHDKIEANDFLFHSHIFLVKHKQTIQIAHAYISLLI